MAGAVPAEGAGQGRDPEAQSWQPAANSAGRGVVFDPLLLILDEPFAGLDPEAVDSMSEVLHERAEAGVPVVFSSHQLELVERISDRVGIIQRGHLIASGTVEELRGKGPERLWVDAPAAPVGWA